MGRKIDTSILIQKRDKIWHSIPPESSNNYCAKQLFGRIDFLICCDMEKRR